jgi:hypothetical protein
MAATHSTTSTRRFPHPHQPNCLLANLTCSKLTNRPVAHIEAASGDRVGAMSSSAHSGRMTGVFAITRAGLGPRREFRGGGYILFFPRTPLWALPLGPTTRPARQRPEPQPARPDRICERIASRGSSAVAVSRRATEGEDTLRRPTMRRPPSRARVAQGGPANTRRAAGAMRRQITEAGAALGAQRRHITPSSRALRRRAPEHHPILETTPKQPLRDVKTRTSRQTRAVK